MEQYKIPPVLVWNGERVIPEAKAPEYGFPICSGGLRTKNVLKNGSHYYCLKGAEVAEFICKNRKSLEMMYANSIGVIRRIHDTWYYVLTLKGLKKIDEEQPYRHLGETIEFLSANYFHPEKQEQKFTTETILKGYDCMNAKDLLSELSKGIQELNRMEESAKKQLQEIQAEKQAIKNQLKAILQEAE